MKIKIGKELLIIYICENKPLIGYEENQDYF